MTPFLLLTRLGYQFSSASRAWVAAAAATIAAAASLCHTAAAAAATPTTSAAAAAVNAARLPEAGRLAALQCMQGLADLVLVPWVVTAQERRQRRGPLKLLHGPVVPDHVKATLVDGVRAWLPLALQINEVQHVL